jgi:ABC-type dipeptide/oligopeptide/nickel transport system ATPase subunit
MRGLGVSFLLRRARASWLLLACVAVTVLLATGLAAVLWTFADAVVPFGAQGFLADPQDRVLGINGPVNAREAAADSQQIRAALLDTLGITHCADRTPDRMSGGEQQRAAIATALANQPKLLLADEPTGELDSSTAQDVFSALRTANTELGVTMLVVTHDPAVSSQVRRTIAIRDGKTSSETIRHAATDERCQTTLHAREYATLDRAGRVQLPCEMTRRLGMRNRVELQEEPDHIGVWPDQAADQERQ